MPFALVAILAIGASSASAPVGVGTWSNNGPVGVSNPKLYLDPSNPSILYLTGMAELYKSTDGGENWERVLAGGSNFAISPSNPEVLLYGSVDGPVRSEDRGQTWKRIAYPAGENVTQGPFLFDPRDDNTVYLLQEAILGRFCFCSMGQVYKSGDGGRTWILDFGTGTEGGAYPKIAGALMDARSTIWIFGSALYRRPAGANPSIVLPTPISTLAIDPRDPARVYAGGPDGLYRSLDGGETWALTPLPKNVFSIVLDTANPSEIFARSGASWFRSVDYGLIWSPYSTNGTDVLAFDEASPLVVYGNNGSELRKSVDHGLTWLPIVRGLAATAISALARDPSRAGHAWAAVSDTSYSGALVVRVQETDLFETADAGQTWARRGFLPASNVRSLTFDPVFGALYAGADLGVSGSEDGGESWSSLVVTEQGQGGFTPIVVFAPADTRILYATGDFLFRSVDRGKTWNSFRNLSSPSTVAVDPRNPDIVYANGSDGKGFTGLLKSTDAGATWTRVPPPESVSSLKVLVIDLVESNNVYVGGLRTVYRSPDAGLTWTAGSAVAQVVSMAAHPSRSGELMALDSASRVLRSFDYGMSWRLLPGVPDFGGGVSISLDGEALYLATSGLGVFTYAPVGLTRSRPARAVPFRH